MDKSKKYNPHKWFFAYAKNLEGYNNEYAKVIRSGIILEHTNGLTESLSELYSEYPTKYKQMKKALILEAVDELDKSRKRLIAVLFSLLAWKGKKASMDYVKAIAVNAAQVDSFNEIPLNKLKQLYRIFGEKKNKQANDWVDKIFEKITQDEKETVDNNGS